jgi:hypothetical protein
VFSKTQLAEQLAASRQQLAAEQAFSREQLAEERKAARDQEQLAEAALVEIALAVHDVPGKPDKIYGEPVELPQKRLGAMVTNHGHYATTRVEAQFPFQGNDLRSPARRLTASGETRIFPSLGATPGRPRVTRWHRRPCLPGTENGLRGT